MSHPLPPTPLPAHSIVSLHLSTSARLFYLLASLDAHESYCPISPFWDSRIANFIFKAKANPHLTPIAAISKGFSSPSLFRSIITISPVPPSPTLSHHPEWGEPFSPHYVIYLGPILPPPLPLSPS